MRVFIVQGSSRSVIGGVFEEWNDSRVVAVLLVTNLEEKEFCVVSRRESKHVHSLCLIRKISEENKFYCLSHRRF